MMNNLIVGIIVNGLFLLGIIFLLLIIIGSLITIFKIATRLANKLFGIKGKPEISAGQSVDKVLSQIQTQEQNLINDAELVAVITAAIMASMGDEAPADGLVVRSIKKVNKQAWMRA